MPNIGRECTGGWPKWRIEIIIVRILRGGNRGAAGVPAIGLVGAYHAQVHSSQEVADRDLHAY